MEKELFLLLSARPTTFSSSELRVEYNFMSLHSDSRLSPDVLRVYFGFNDELKIERTNQKHSCLLE